MLLSLLIAVLVRDKKVDTRTRASSNGAMDATKISLTSEEFLVKYPHEHA